MPSQPCGVVPYPVFVEAKNLPPAVSVKLAPPSEVSLGLAAHQTAAEEHVRGVAAPSASRRASIGGGAISVERSQVDCAVVPRCTDDDVTPEASQGSTDKPLPTATTDNPLEGPHSVGLNVHGVCDVPLDFVVDRHAWLTQRRHDLIKCGKPPVGKSDPVDVITEHVGVLQALPVPNHLILNSAADMVAWQQRKLFEIAYEERRARAVNWLSIICDVRVLVLLNRAVQDARDVSKVQIVLHPRCQRACQVWEQRAVSQQRLQARIRSGEMLPPAWHTLQRLRFFADFPTNVLLGLIRDAFNQEVVSYCRRWYKRRQTAHYAAAADREIALVEVRKGEYLYHQEDPTTDIFIVIDGTVELYAIAQPQPLCAPLAWWPRRRGKSKSRENGVLVGEATGPAVVGESEAMTGAIRENSAFCSTDAWAIAISRRCLYGELCCLPSIVAETLHREAALCRCDRLASAFPLTPALFRQVEAFQCWHVAALNDLIAAFRVEVVPRLADALDERHDLSMAVVIRGHLTLSEFRVDSTGATEPVACTKRTCRAGELINAERALITDPDDCVFMTLTAEQTSAVVWKCPRSALIEVSMRHAVCAVDSRRLINEHRAAALASRRPPYETIAALRDDGFFSFACPPSCVRAWWSTVTPVVYSAGDALCREGESFPPPFGKHELLVVVKGVVQVRPSRRSMQSQPFTIDAADSGGVVVGGVEFVLKASHHLQSVTCATTCYAWKGRRGDLEQALIESYPLVWTALCREETTSFVSDCFLQGDFRPMLTYAAVPALAGQFRQ